MVTHQILSPARLPVSPHPRAFSLHDFYKKGNQKGGKRRLFFSFCSKACICSTTRIAAHSTPRHNRQIRSRGGRTPYRHCSGSTRSGAPRRHPARSRSAHFPARGRSIRRTRTEANKSDTCFLSPFVYERALSSTIYGAKNRSVRAMPLAREASCPPRRTLPYFLCANRGYRDKTRRQRPCRAPSPHPTPSRRRKNRERA